MNATFPKSERLCSKIIIDDLFANGNARRSGGFTIKYLQTHTGEKIGFPQILISVPKRFQKRAVDRNRTKRLIREVYRKRKTEHLNEGNIHALAIIFASTKVPDYAFVDEHLSKILALIK